MSIVSSTKRHGSVMSRPGRILVEEAGRSIVQRDHEGSLGREAWTLSREYLCGVNVRRCARPGAIEATRRWPCYG